MTQKNIARQLDEVENLARVSERGDCRQELGALLKSASSSENASREYLQGIMASIEHLKNKERDK